MSLETREADHECPKHGSSKVSQTRLAGKDWLPVRCPHCVEEQLASAELNEKSARARSQGESFARRVELNLSRSMIPARFQGCTFEGFQAEDGGTRKVLSSCEEYAQRFLEHKAAGQGIVMCGNTGTGKTHLACAIAGHVIRHTGTSAIYTTASRAFRRVKDTYRRDSALSENDAIAYFVRPDLLLMDEIGVQFGSDAELNILFDIVNERYERMLPTILISNLALPKLTEYAGERVIDRMRENGGKLLVFDWGSHRGAT